MSTLVRQLTDARLLIRRADDTDRRVVRLELAAEMQRKIGEFRDRRVAMLSAAMAQLSLGDQRRLAVDVFGRLAGLLPDRAANE